MKLKNLKFKDKVNINILMYVGIMVVSMIILASLDMNKSEHSYAISIIERSLVFAVVALSMNIVTGFTGLFSLGQAGFMALGAYTTAILTIPLKSRPGVYYMNGILHALENAIVPIPVAIILGVLIAAAFAALYRNNAHPYSDYQSSPAAAPALYRTALSRTLHLYPYRQLSSECR